MFRMLAPIALCLVGGLFLGAAEEADYIKVEIKGTLKTGIVAIGGETTGTTITAGKTTFELDLGGKEDFVQFAEKHDGKTVVVQGNLVERPGVEVKLRRIITVTKMQAAELKPN